MDSDEAFRQFAAALWALAGAVRKGSIAQRDAALATAVAALGAARGRDHFLIVHEADGSLHMNGRRLSYDSDTFEPASGLVRLFRLRGIGEVLFESDCDVAHLQPWITAFVGAAGLDDLEAAGGGAIHVGSRDAQQAPPVPLARGGAPAAVESRLGATFLVHTLVAALGPLPFVPPRIARLVVGALVDHLLAHGGPEPLAALQGESLGLRRGLHVAVYAVLAARAVGWPEEHLAGLALAALLHRVGDALDPARPEAAGLCWMLGHGCDEVWLRGALVQRLWRIDHGSGLVSLPPDDDLGAAIVRCAVAVEIAARAGCDLDQVRQRLAAESRRGRFPLEIAAATGELLAAVVPAA